MHPRRRHLTRIPILDEAGRELIPGGYVVITEEKYITDTLARPRPLAIAGRLKHYEYDPATRVLRVCMRPNPSLGATEIFVPADRCYSDGFRVDLGSTLAMTHNPDAPRLHILHTTGPEARTQANQIRWDAESDHLVIDKWVLPAPELTLTIRPLLGP